MALPGETLGHASCYHWFFCLEFLQTCRICRTNIQLQPIGHGTHKLQPFTSISRFTLPARLRAWPLHTDSALTCVLLIPCITAAVRHAPQEPTRLVMESPISSTAQCALLVPSNLKLAPRMPLTASCVQLAGHQLHQMPAAVVQLLPQAHTLALSIQLLEQSWEGHSWLLLGQ